MSGLRGVGLSGGDLPIQGKLHASKLLAWPPITGLAGLLSRMRLRTSAQPVYMSSQRSVGIREL